MAEVAMSWDMGTSDPIADLQSIVNMPWRPSVTWISQATASAILAAARTRLARAEKCYERARLNLRRSTRRKRPEARRELYLASERLRQAVRMANAWFKSTPVGVALHDANVGEPVSVALW